jgi:dienelactone hydrolase
MLSAARRTRLILASGVITVILAALALAACAASARPHAASSSRVASTRAAASPPSSPTPSSSPSPSAAPIGTASSYQVGEQQMIFTEPARNGPTGQYLDARTLVTTVQYPLAPGSAAGSAAHPATGPLPLLLFAPGFQQCTESYEDLLRIWASAGYVVAAVTFPNTNCQLGTAENEQDLVNQPADMSFVLSSLLTLSAQPDNLLSGLLNSQEIAAAGQSDGGDTVAALVANTCCSDNRVKAAAVLSGAEWPPMPGQYFAHAAPPMLFVQGNADTINPPSASVRLYGTDGAGTRYYLNLLGAGHLAPYEGANPVEAVVGRVTLAFFDRYVLGQTGAEAAMTQAGNVGGTASLVSGGHLPRNPG